MGSSSAYLFSLVFFTLILLLPSHRQACFTSIFSFGDSLADTGNLLFFLNNTHRVSQLPYGQTFFHHPTGRFSDGRLVIDFIAEAIGLPLVPPYLSGDSLNFEKGVNFAVAGATALNDDFFKSKGIYIKHNNFSLDVQVELFKRLLPSICSTISECEEKLSGALFLMGEIGGNDYNDPFFQGRSLEEITTFVPLVINAISRAISEVIEVGARTLLVPGNLPIGCNSAYLTYFHVSNNNESHDQVTGCINWLNEFSQYHNQLLIDELQLLRKLHPHVTIIYADYFEALMTIFQSPEEYGFRGFPLRACCGGGGLYNYNSSCGCGEMGSTVCEKPSNYVIWDGLHLTEAAYKHIATGLVQGKFANPPFSQTCFPETILNLLDFNQYSSN
ncbi:putative sinapine esterase [Dioscorea sansibarensis]